MRISQIFLRRGHDDGSAPADSAAGVSPWGDPPRLLTDPATMTPVRDLLMAPPALKPLPTEVAARVRHAVIGVPLIPNTDLNPLHQDSGIGHRDGIGNRDGMDPGDGIPVDPGRGPLDSWVPDSKPLDSSVPHSATWPKPSATRASSSSVPPSQPLWEPARSAPVSGLKLAAVAAGAAMLFGETMVGWRVWDVIRAIDYLQTRPEVDGERVGVMGISGGGTVSLFAAAVDDRIGAAMVSGYFNTFRDSIVSLSHCLDNYVPGLLRYMEMYDVAGLIAPRALFVESGEEDHIFPIAAAREAFDRTRPMYRALGAEDRLAHEVFAGGHEFNGGRAWKFLNGVFSV